MFNKLCFLVMQCTLLHNFLFVHIHIKSCHCNKETCCVKFLAKFVEGAHIFFLVIPCVLSPHHNHGQLEGDSRRAISNRGDIFLNCVCVRHVLRRFSEVVVGIYLWAIYLVRINNISRPPVIIFKLVKVLQMITQQKLT